MNQIPTHPYASSGGGAGIRYFDPNSMGTKRTIFSSKTLIMFFKSELIVNLTLVNCFGVWLESEKISVQNLATPLVKCNQKGRISLSTFFSFYKKQ